MTISFIFVWLGAASIAAVILILVLFWIAERYFKDD